ncbi:MAG: class I SAM-dependent methyltransferase [Solirubrobacterales bacterium]
MEGTTINPVEFREAQRVQWNVAAKGWSKWRELMEENVRVISERLVELAGVQPGSRVLDVACGLGEPTRTAATAAGPEGSVVATDISSEMLAFARELAKAEGLGNVEFVESDAAGLDFPENSFDAAVSRWGIIFDPDGEAAAGRIRGFLKDGARMAISSWGPPERVPMLAVPMQTVMKRLDVPPPPPGTPGPLSRPTHEAIAGLLEGGGFSDVEVEEQEVVIEWESAEQFTTFVKEIAPPITAMIEPHPQEEQEATWAAITEAVGGLADKDGKVVMTNLVLMAAGKA